jgi:hypothetical protein
MTTTLSPDERVLIDTLRRRFYAKYQSLADNPQRLEVTEAEEAAYLPILIREHGHPPLVIRNAAGEMGHPFKGVPLIVVEQTNG